MNNDKFMFILNNEAKYSMTKNYEFNQIINIMLNDFNNLKDIIITDAMSGVGCDSIHFSEYFKIVQSIEIKKNSYDILTQNIKNSFKHNITPKCDNYLYIFNKLYQDIVYIDAPWNGICYKKQEYVDLYVSNVPLYIIVNDIIKDNFTKYIYLKVPLNMNLTNYLKFNFDEYIIYKENTKPSFKLLKIKCQ